MDIKMRWTVASRHAVKMGIERRRMEGRLGWVGRSVISASSTTRINSLIKRINELQPGQSIHLSLFLATLLITCR